jgi:hypothetical protein
MKEQIQALQNYVLQDRNEKRKIVSCTFSEHNIRLDLVDGDNIYLQPIELLNVLKLRSGL